jgi:predicted PurR-regulated permease PerM
MNEEKGLKESMQRLAERFERIYSYKATFLRGIVTGVGTVIGATLVATLVVFILFQFFDLVGVRDFLEQFISPEEITETPL